MDITTVITLSEKEEQFVLHLAKGLRPTRAATAAGYAVASARPLLLKPHIGAAVRHCAANMARCVAYINAANA